MPDVIDVEYVTQKISDYFRWLGYWKEQMVCQKIQTRKEKNGGGSLFFTFLKLKAGYKWVKYKIIPFLLMILMVKGFD